MGVRLPPPSLPRRSCAGDDGRLQRTPIERFIGRLNRNPIFLRILNLRFKYGYRFLSRLLTKDDVLFLNYGYDEDPPMDLPLAASDESDRFPIQLYHRTATQVDLAGEKVLEVSCGHGGGASYLTRTLHPATYTGLDLNTVGIEFCRKRHNLPGLDFVQGNAESLPFPDQSFNVVINVEAAINYKTSPVSLPKWNVCCARGGISSTPISATPTKSPPGSPSSPTSPCAWSRDTSSMRRLCAGWRKIGFLTSSLVVCRISRSCAA